MTMTSHANKKKLGLWMLTALVAGNMIGSGIFLLPSSLAAYGSISLFGWLFTSSGALLLALVFAKLSAYMPRVGGPYAYCREGFGDFIGFQTAYNYWIASWVGNAAIAVAFTGYLSFFWPALANNKLLSFFVSIAAIWSTTFINIIGVRQAGAVQLVTTVLKLLPLLLISLIGLAFIQPTLLMHFNISGQSNITAFSNTAALTLWAFIGLESASIPADNIDNPQKNIPRATIFGVLIASFVYILSSIVVMGIIPLNQLAHSSAPFAEAARLIFGRIGSILIAVGAIISCFGTLNGWVLLQGQVPLAAARDHLFPKIFIKESRFGTPIVGLLISSILITLLMLLTLNEGLTKQFTSIILIATLSSLIPYLFTAMAELLLFLKHPNLFNHGKQLTRSVVISVLASAYAFWTIIGSGPTIVFYGTLLMLSSVPMYVWMKWRKREIITA